MPSSFTPEYQKFIKLRFIDSLQFMPKSLDYLSSLLPLDKKKILQSECGEFSEEKIQLLQRKGVFCYDYFDSWDKLHETSLPSKGDFYSNLYESHISDDDYSFAQNVWNKFDIKTLGEYSDLYMKVDILFLADVFENFREVCFNIYKLDPAHYYTAPGLSFDAMLKYTQVRIGCCSLKEEYVTRILVMLINLSEVNVPSASIRSPLKPKIEPILSFLVKLWHW